MAPPGRPGDRGDPVGRRGGDRGRGGPQAAAGKRRQAAPPRGGSREQREPCCTGRADHAARGGRCVSACRRQTGAPGLAAGSVPPARRTGPAHRAQQRGASRAGGATGHRAGEGAAHRRLEDAAREVSTHRRSQAGERVRSQDRDATGALPRPGSPARSDGAIAVAFAITTSVVTAGGRRSNEIDPGRDRGRLCRGRRIAPCSRPRNAGRREMPGRGIVQPGRASGNEEECAPKLR